MISASLNIVQRLTVAQQIPVIISLDMHDKSTYALGVNVITGEIHIDHNIIGGPETVLRALNKLDIKDKCEILYEAGNHGYHPFRLFTNAGYRCKIIAPSTLPDNRKRKVEKTDRSDCIRNLDYHLGGLIRYVSVPSPKIENTRELNRYRIACTWKITKVKQKIGSFTKRHGYCFDGTKNNWTITHRKWLKSIELDTALRTVLNMMLDELSAEESRFKQIEFTIDQAFKNDADLLWTKNLYELIPGFGPVNAITVALEAGDLSRFAHPKALMKFTGLIPGKHQSGKTDPELGITKAGNSFLRIALVGAAKTFGDRRCCYSRAEIDKMEEPLKEFISRLQDRLFGRYAAMRLNKKNSNKIKCAIARELCGFIWELENKIKPALKKDKYLKVA